MHVYGFAYHKTRCGEWEQTSRDRERFKRRIDRIHEVLMPAHLKKCKAMGIK